MSPREFWIPTNANNEPTHIAWHEDPGKERDESIFPSVIHVIEASFVKDLLRERTALLIERDNLKMMLEEEIKKNQSLVHGRHGI